MSLLIGAGNLAHDGTAATPAEVAAMVDELSNSSPTFDSHRCFMRERRQQPLILWRLQPTTSWPPKSMRGIMGCARGTPRIRVSAAGRSRSQWAGSAPKVLVVPCTTALTTEVPSLCVEIEPDHRNGFDRLNWAITYGVTSASKRRIVRETAYSVSPEQVAAIRSRMAETLDIAT